MSPAQTDVLRAFRSADFRDLARQALRQGWTAYVRQGGHVDVVNPAGVVVQLSATAHTAGPVLAGKRHEFERAGLTLGGHHRTRRYRRGTAAPKPDGLWAATPSTPEVPTVTEIPNLPAPDVRWPLLRQVAHENRSGAEKAGGKYALKPGTSDVVEVAGYEVTIAERVDGKWLAYTRDLAKVSRRRQFMDTGRTAILEKVELSLRNDPPVVTPDETVPRPAPAPRPAQAPKTKANGAAAHPEAPAGSPTVWRAVGLDPADYPTAAALDALHAAAAPAIAALMAAGKTDAANLITAELDLTPTEAELLRLWQTVVRGG